MIVFDFGGGMKKMTRKDCVLRLGLGCARYFYVVDKSFARRSEGRFIILYLKKTSRSFFFDETTANYSIIISPLCSILPAPYLSTLSYFVTRQSSKCFHHICWIRRRKRMND